VSDFPCGQDSPQLRSELVHKTVKKRVQPESRLSRSSKSLLRIMSIEDVLLIIHMTSKPKPILMVVLELGAIGVMSSISLLNKHSDTMTD